MKMFCYYFLHSTWNQLKKLVRTWAFILLLSFVTIGGLAVFAVRWYLQRLSSVEGLLPSDFMEFFEGTGMTGLDVFELGLGILILGVLLIQVFSAEKSVSRLFMQADVNLLFASPLTPQTVLLFRLMTTLGSAFAAAAVLLLEIPTFMHRFHLCFYAALSLPAAWLLLMGFSVLLKALIYETGSRHPFFRKNLRWFVLGFLALLGGLFYRQYRQSGEEALLLCAHRFLSGRYGIPVWGWLKGFVIGAAAGDRTQSLLCLFSCLFLLGILLFLAFRLPADYYEDVLSHTQQIALLLEDYRQNGVQSVAAFFSRPKNRDSGRAFLRGRGASVYFWKVIHTRLRSYPTRLRALFFTRTGITCLLAAVAAGWFDRKFMDAPVIYIPVLVLAALVFFRAVLSPVSEDMRKASFLLQPDPIWQKLFFSALGGSCSCALDTVLPLMAGCRAAGFSPLYGLLFLPVLMSVDFFASAGTAFVEISLPRAIGSTFKQVIQILVLYMALIFDGMLLTSGITGGFLGAGFLLVTLADLLFGAFFLGMTGVWLYPCSGRPPKSCLESREAGRCYSCAGAALAGMYAGIHLCRSFFSLLDLPALITVYAPIYLIGLPLFILLFRPDRPDPGAGETLGLRAFLLLIPVCFFVMYSGSAFGNLLTAALQSVRLFPVRTAPALPEDSFALQAFFLAVISPVMEEYVFRRCLLERTLPYGERTAVLVSALLFGLFHSTLSQFCYAFLLGIVFGCVYVRTRRLRYTAGLHILINSLSSLLLPLMLARLSGSVSFETMSRVPVTQLLGEPGVLPLLAYLAFLFVCSLFGAVLTAFAVREKALPRQGVSLKSALSAPGILVFAAAAVFGIAINL